MKSKMISAIIMLIISLLALAIFIALYIDEVRKTEEEYKKHYLLSISSASENISLYISKGTDTDMRYNMIISDIGAARTIVFLIKGYTEQQKSMNELHSCFIKYPDQTVDKFDEIREALNMIVADDEKCYDKVIEIVESYDKKGS